MQDSSRSSCSSLSSTLPERNWLMLGWLTPLREAIHPGPLSADAGSGGGGGLGAGAPAPGFGRGVSWNRGEQRAGVLVLRAGVDLDGGAGLDDLAGRHDG